MNNCVRNERFGSIIPRYNAECSISLPALYQRLDFNNYVLFLLWTSMSFNILARTEEKGGGGGVKNGSPKEVGKNRMVLEKKFFFIYSHTPIRKFIKVLRVLSADRTLHYTLPRHLF